MIGETLYTAFGVGSALAASVGLFAHIIGYDRDRAFYATVLTVVASLYVLFAIMAGGRGLVPEIAFFAVLQPWPQSVSERASGSLQPGWRSTARSTSFGLPS